MAPREVTRPDAGGQPVAAVVGERHGFLLAAEGKHRDHGTEDFLLRQRAIGIGACKDRGPDITAATPARGSATIEQQVCTLADARLDETAHARGLRGTGKRAEARRRIARMTNPHRARLRQQVAEDAIEDRGLHQQARTRDADLPLVPQRATGDLRHHHLELRPVHVREK